MKNAIRHLIPITIALCLLAATFGRTAPPAKSEIRANGGNGFGTIGAYAMRFANIDALSGTAISYADSPIDGGAFRINEDGVYAISYTDGNAAGNPDYIAVTLNASPSTRLNALNFSEVLCRSYIPVSFNAGCSATVVLQSGDMVRAHRTFGAESEPGTNEAARFIIAKVEKATP